MKISLAGMKNKVAAKFMGGAVISMAAMLGMTPMTAFAGGAEAECICEEKCDEKHINEKCEVCAYDWKCCEGKEAEENWGPLTPDGNMNLVDDYGSIEAGGKQFVTVTSKNGNYFYLIIDRDDQGEETVHFLNLVDEADLLSLMEEEEVEKYLKAIGLAEATEEPEPEVKTPEPVTEEPAEEEPVVIPEKETNVTGIMGVVLLISVAGIGGFLYFKNKKKNPSKPSGPDPDADYDEDEDYLDSILEDDLDFLDLDKDAAEDMEDGEEE